jgi:large conductance mechanosensitive channel
MLFNTLTLKLNHMAIIKEFKEFAMRGNVVDLAVGVIIGGAFGKIITSFVSDVIMPIVNPLIPGRDWKLIQIGPGIKIGSFIGTVVDFIIVAFAIFMLIKALNRFQKKNEIVPPTPAPTKEEILLTEIRDLLKTKTL